MAYKFTKFYLAIFGICVIPYVHSAQTPSLMDKIKELGDFLKTIGNISTLEYGDTCHSDEIQITEIAENVLEDIMKIDDSSLLLLESELDKVTNALRTFLSSGNKICNGRKLLRCDESTNTCKCGPRRLSNTEFSYVQSVNGKCYWAKDTPCFPTYDDLDQFTNWCATNTKCAFTNDSGMYIDCDFYNLHKYNITNADEILKTCYCVGVEVEIKKDNSMEDWKSPTHIFSSANTKYVNLFFYDSVNMAVIVPILIIVKKYYMNFLDN